MKNNKPFVQVLNLLTAADDQFSGLKGGVLAIGNFDGVHKGHRVVLETALNLAATQGGQCKAIAMTFEPHPRTVFKPDAPVFRLTPRHEKSRLMAAMGLDGVVVTPFDHDFSQMEAEDFVCNLLIEKLAVSHVVVGYDFHFGRARQGSPEFLMEMGKAHGFAVSVIPAQKNDEGALVYSSSATRDCLAKGNIELANDILGYHYFVAGEVVHGRKEGRELGYPTANMALEANSELKHGIYAVQLRVDGKVMDGVASFGRRPMFDNGPPLLETYVFDFDGDLYGKNVEVAFFKYLRGEEAFDSLQALLDQMAIDCENAREVLQNAEILSSIDQSLNGE
ncbi:MAG: bifunctional riboflavin kinase/FAD synthetase [Hyphomicrobiales bacterium]